MKVDDAMTIDLSVDKSDDAYEEEGVVQLGQEGSAVELVSLETSSEEEEEAKSEGQEIPLKGSTLGGANFDEEEPEEIARARLALLPRSYLPPQVS